MAMTAKASEDVCAISPSGRLPSGCLEVFDESFNLPLLNVRVCRGIGTFQSRSGHSYVIFLRLFYSMH